MKTTIRLLSLLLALAVPATSGAWVKSVCSGNGEELDWDNETTQVRFSSVSFPAGAWRDSLDDAIDRWNDDPSDFNFTTLFGDTSIGLSNDQSEAWITSDNDYDPAMAVLRYKGLTFCSNPRIVEADILFYKFEDYTTSMDTAALWGYDTNDNGSSDRPFQTTAVHELGHALGLEHENDEYNVMGEDWTHIHANGTTARAYPGEDASDGAIDLYGSVSIQDLGVVHWKYDFADGEYSRHEHTKLYTSAGIAPLDSDPYGDWVEYFAEPGDTIQVELSYENNGLSDQTVDVGIYLSDNNLITTSDDRLAGFSTTLGRGNVSTRKTVVTIPADQPTGVYWIGAVIDEDGDVGEVTESNNATWIRLVLE